MGNIMMGAATCLGIGLYAGLAGSLVYAADGDASSERLLVPAVEVAIPGGVGTEASEPVRGDIPEPVTGADAAAELRDNRPPDAGDTQGSDEAQASAEPSGAAPAEAPAPDTSLPPVERVEVPKPSCQELAAGTAEVVLGAIILADGGSDSTFCTLKAGEVCSDFSEKLKEYGSLKMSPQGGSACALTDRK